MGIANIDALVTELAALKESLRIKLQSLANINPNYQMNAAYIARLKAEVVVLNENIATVESRLASASKPAVQPAPPPTTNKIENAKPSVAGPTEAQTAAFLEANAELQNIQNYEPADVDDAIEKARLEADIINGEILPRDRKSVV